MRRLLILIIFILGCTTKDCIDESEITTKRLPEFRGAFPTTIEQSFIFLDSLLAEDIRKVIKCSDEYDIKKQRVLPGLWMWIHNNFQLYNNTTQLGQLFEQQNIDKMQRSSLMGILYHRHLNGDSIKKKDLFLEYRILNDSKGRVSSLSQRAQITDEEYLQIKRLSFMSDSLMAINGKAGVKSILNEKELSHKSREMIDNRNLVLDLTEDIRIKASSQENYSKSLDDLKELGYSSQLTDFNNLSFGQKIIILERARIDILEKENNTQH